MLHFWQVIYELRIDRVTLKINGRQTAFEKIVPNDLYEILSLILQIDAALTFACSTQNF